MTPLPEPQKVCWIGHTLFSADQMLAYASECVAAERERWLSEAKVAYMDGVDWQHHVGFDMQGTLVFPSTADTLRFRPCAEKCGVVRVLMIEDRWMVEQNLEQTP